MKKPLVLAALSGLILVGAAYPGPDRFDDRDAAVSAEGGQHYRPCRSRRDDRCIQLYERGVSARYARWLRDGDPGFDEAVRYAVYEEGADRRHDMRRRHHERVAAADHHGHHGRAAPTRPGPAHARHRNARLAMADVVRCDDHASARPVMRMRTRQMIRPAPRQRTREDGDVRGM